MSTAEDKLIVKVKHLIALATKNNQKEEARTAAVQACTIIADAGLQIVRTGYVPPPTPKGRKNTDAPPAARQPRKPGSAFKKRDIEWVSIFATYPTFCPYCHRNINPDTKVMAAIGFGRYHEDCWRRIKADDTVEPLNREVVERYYQERRADADSHNQ